MDFSDHSSNQVSQVWNWPHMPCSIRTKWFTKLPGILDRILLKGWNLIGYSSISTGLIQSCTSPGKLSNTVKGNTTPSVKYMSPQAWACIWPRPWCFPVLPSEHISIIIRTNILLAWMCPNLVINWPNRKLPKIMCIKLTPYGTKLTLFKLVENHHWHKSDSIRR